MAEKPFLQDCLNGRREEGERENRCGERRADEISGIQEVWKEEERKVDGISGIQGVWKEEERRVDGISGIQGVFAYPLPLLSETRKEQKRGLIEILEERKERSSHFY